MAKAKKNAKSVENLTVDQSDIIANINGIAKNITEMHGGESIDVVADQLETISTKLEKRFVTYNNRGALKAVRKEKLEARKTKLTEQLAKVTKTLG